MMKIAAGALLVVLCAGLSACSSSPPNRLLGTWKSNRDLTVGSIRQNETRQMTDDEIKHFVETGSTWTFTRSRSKAEMDNGMHFDYPYTIVSSDAQTTTITLGDPGATKTDIFHFDDNDTIWTTYENDIGGFPVTQFRQYYKRVP
jgi:hypothetical protein